MLDDLSDSNMSGLFRRQAMGVSPLTNQRRNISGYYITTPGGGVERPPDGWKEEFFALLQDTVINDHYSIACDVPETVDLKTEISIQSSAKRKAEAHIAAHDSKKPKHGPLASRLVVETYCDSPKAKKLFLGNPNDDRGVKEVLQERIEQLQQASNRTVDGWKDMIDKHDKVNLCSSYDVFTIRQRCSILCLAYIHALEDMNAVQWIADCCAWAIADSSEMGLEAAATSDQTVAGWNILLRSIRERLPFPNPKVLNKQKHPLLELLEYF